jgi:hypothetical protein
MPDNVQIIEDPPTHPPLPRSASNPKPKGILKNPLPSPAIAQSGGQLVLFTIPTDHCTNDEIQQSTMGRGESCFDGDSEG